MSVVTYKLVKKTLSIYGSVFLMRLLKLVNMSLRLLRINFNFQLLQKKVFLQIKYSPKNLRALPTVFIVLISFFLCTVYIVKQ